MVDKRIEVSEESLNSVQAYIEAAKTSLARALDTERHSTSSRVRSKIWSAEQDLKRAEACLEEARMTDEELRDKK